MFNRISNWFSSRRGKARRSREYFKVKRIYMSIYWRIRYRRIRMGMLDWLSFILYIVISILIAVYIARNLSDITPPLFDLAKICALLGGFVLAGGFFATSSQDLKYEMRRIGALYLLATVAFVILGLSLPIYILKIEGAIHYIFVVLTIVSMVVGIVSFALATSWLTLVTPKLLRK